MAALTFLNQPMSPKVLKIFGSTALGGVVLFGILTQNISLILLTAFLSTLLFLVLRGKNLFPQRLAARMHENQIEATNFAIGVILLATILKFDLILVAIVRYFNLV